MNLSKHAQIRCQQRGFRSREIGALLKYGTIKEKNGAFECYIPKREFNEIISRTMSLT